MRKLKSLFGRKRRIKVRAAKELPLGESAAADLLQQFEDGEVIEGINEFFQVDFSEIDVQRSIGKGGGGAFVYKAVWNAQEVAFKCFAIEDGGELGVMEFQREASLYQSVRHPNILMSYGCTLRPPRVGILMEYCKFGDLCDFLINNPVLPLYHRFRIMYQISGAVNYLHKRNVLHRDLKLENVLVNRSLQPKLMDFGLGKMVQRMSATKTTAIGTPQYMAPEIVDAHYDLKVDVYSLAIMLFQMLTNIQHVYGQRASFQAHLLARNGQRPELSELRKLVRDQDLRDDCESLLETMWDGDPTQRPTCAQVYRRLKTLMERVPEERISIVVEDGYVPGEAKKAADAQEKKATTRGRGSRNRTGRQRKRNRGTLPGAEDDEEEDPNAAAAAAAAATPESVEEPTVSIVIESDRCPDGQEQMTYDLAAKAVEPAKIELSEALGLDLAVEVVGAIRKKTRGGRWLLMTKDETVMGLTQGTELRVEITPV